MEGLLPHLKYYERNKQIDYWIDTKIKPGARWRGEIEQALTSAKVAVLLVSIDFLTSEFIAENELPPLLAAAQAKNVKVLLMLLRPCRLDMHLSQFQTLNKLSMPVSKMKGYQREELWVELADAIRDALESQQSNSVSFGGSAVPEWLLNDDLPPPSWPHASTSSQLPEPRITPDEMSEWLLNDDLPPGWRGR